MNAARQVAHVAAKDVRDSAGSLAGYWAVVMLVTLNARAWRPDSEFLAGSSIYLIVLYGIVIAASFVLADSPTRPGAYWTSKPLAPFAVLAAKWLVIVVAVLTPPVVGQYAALHARGLSGDHLGYYLLRSALTYAAWLLAAMTVAAISRSLRAFLFTVVLVPIGAVIAAAAWGAISINESNLLTRSLVVVGFGGSVAVLVGLYQRRDASRAWRSCATAVAVAGLVCHIGVPDLDVTAIDSEPSRPVGASASVMTATFRDYAHPFSITVQANTTGAEQLVSVSDESLVFMFHGGDSLVMPLSGRRIVLAAPPPSLESPWQWRRPAPSMPIGATQFDIELDSAQHAAVVAHVVDSLVLQGRGAAWDAHTIAEVPARTGAMAVGEGDRVTVLTVGRRDADVFADVRTSALSRSIVDSPGDQGLSFTRAALVNLDTREAISLEPQSTSSGTTSLVLSSPQIHGDSTHFRSPIATPNGEGFGPRDAWFTHSHLLIIGWHWRSSFSWRISVGPARTRP